jgi:hypothetical protein
MDEFMATCDEWQVPPAKPSTMERYAHHLLKGHKPHVDLFDKSNSKEKGYAASTVRSRVSAIKKLIQTELFVSDYSLSPVVYDILKVSLFIVIGKIAP